MNTRVGMWQEFVMSEETKIMHRHRGIAVANLMLDTPGMRFIDAVAIVLSLTPRQMKLMQVTL